MDPSQRNRLADDLKGLVRGELLFDELSRALYSTDASIFQVSPLGVVVPRDEEDVQAVVRYAAENRVPLVPRGAGSGLAGEALGPGLIVDLSRHFRSIGEVGSDTVRVQPGVVLRDLNARLAVTGRRFAPDPASAAQCTLGGMLATNASGSRSLRHGYTRDHVESLRIVMDTGEVFPVGREPRRLVDGPNSRLRDVVAAVVRLLEHSGETIQSCRPRTRYDRCGYLLHDVLTAQDIDLAKLLIGTEGTLALFTEATLKTIPLPEGRSIVLLGFSSLETALRAAQRALAGRPVACDLIDRRVLTLARGSDAEVAALVPSAVEAVLLVEYETASPAEANRAAQDLIDQMYRVNRLAMLAAAGQEAEEIDRLWRLRELALPSLYGMRGGPQPLAFVEDVGVPAEELPDYLLRIQEILQKHETTASFLIHTGTGQVHARPFLDLQRPEDSAKLWTLADEIHSLAIKLGGTVSSQHGTGLARTPWVARQFGPLAAVFRELKEIFDPHQLLNPGKIVGPDPERSAWPLRKVQSPKSKVQSLHDESQSHEPGTLNGEPESRLGTLDFGLWTNFDELRTEYLNCNGCGQCRTGAPAQRMCPIFRATHAEAAAPRAKANLLRHVFEESGDARLLGSDAVRQVADLCVNCKMCAHECPAHVNVPRLMLEAKAANVAEHGMVRSDWAMARTEEFARFGSAFALLTNTALESRLFRWFLEKLVGVSRRRRLPTFAVRSFLRRAARRGWTRRPRSNRLRVAYFVDVFANYNDPQIAEAVVAVLHHNDIEVYVPPGQVGCGMAPLAYGDVETARETALRNLRVLADLAREGYAILCSEPTAALTLTRDYLDLMNDSDARLVADHTVELTGYLGDLHRRGRLRTDFQPLNISVGHHVPCHLKALGRSPAAPGLLSLVPGLHVHTIDVSCSGMAGTFGLKAENYAVSLEAGRPMLEELARPGILFGSTECSACRMQMEEGSGKRTLHPVQYLALAYGLMPEMTHRLRSTMP